ncbi:MAG: aminoacyl-tRNA hydrolase [Alphaproteobacteria bacterium]|nr:aminoacyl-tRNA hydrolase [Thalassospira sp.]MCE2965049.1 aminoacyl-tRNA hydrolase [Alphaproteobacteria bacterium]
MTASPRLIVGLGNPGSEYAQHRHNVGFMVADSLSTALKTSFSSKFSGLFASAQVASEKIFLLKPQTYMNLSGNSVQAAAQFYKIPNERITVLHDELDLAFGTVRMKTGGGDAGHNGLKSITAALGAEYTRIRIGIGHPGHKDAVSDYVLSPFSAAERETLPSVLVKAMALLSL